MNWKNMAATFIDEDGIGSILTVPRVLPSSGMIKCKIAKEQDRQGDQVERCTTIATSPDGRWIALGRKADSHFTIMNVDSIHDEYIKHEIRAGRNP